MDLSQLITEEDIAQIMWLQLAQYGVMIDNITEDGDIYFTVPKTSEYKAFAQQYLPGMEASTGTTDVEMSGDLLRAFAESYFESEGFKPHGGIRDVVWTEFMGQVRKAQEEFDIKQEDPKLLRL